MGGKDTQGTLSGEGSTVRPSDRDLETRQAVSTRRIQDETRHREGETVDVRNLWGRERGEMLGEG